MRRRGLAFGFLAAALAAAPAHAYYHYVHYLNGAAVYEKFDLNSLPSQTVQVFVSDSGPQSAKAFPIVLAQVRQAAEAWNSIKTSALRLSFSGLKASAQEDKTPTIDVVFSSDLPPGVLAQAAPTVSTTPVTGSDGAQFFPILKSVVMLNANTDLAPGPAYTETFFTTTLHEMGHTIGLQHTFTSSAMAQGVVRNTTRLRPLEADDIAAVSALYGKTGWSGRFGSVSGRITSNGEPVAMASVVALPGVGAPVSALTGPDGAYTIKGIPPGLYLLYVHPLPPNADIRKPVDAAGTSVAASGPFETLFFPSARGPATGTREFSELAPFNVDAGVELKDYSIDVQPRSSVPIYGLVTFSYFNQDKQAYYWDGTAVTPAFVSLDQPQATVTFRSDTGSTPVPVSAVMLGGFSDVTLKSYSSGVAAYFTMPIFPVEGIRHLLLNFENDAYVLPYAMTVVRRAPPSVSALNQNADGTVTVTGLDFGPDTRIFFDGTEARVSQPFTGSRLQGSITVTPPPGYSGQEAHVVVYNEDGQSSLTLDSATVAYGGQPQYPAPVYTYPVVGQPTLTFTPASLPAGGYSKVQVTASNMDLTHGPVSLGFGRGDVFVEKVWVQGPDSLVANLRVNSAAAPSASSVSLISGSRLASTKAGFQSQPGDAAKPLIQTVANANPTQATIYPGGGISINGANLGQSVSSVRVKLNDAEIALGAVSSSQVTATIPTAVSSGPATLLLNNGSLDSYPVMVQISLAPPVIRAVARYSGNAVDSSSPATKGDAISISLAGLDPTVAGDLSRVSVTLGDLNAGVVRLFVQDGAASLTALLGDVPPGASAPLRVWVDGSASDPWDLAIMPAR
jgi:uncharacterized protein (TIGR03437 family)